jgi:hypothetical protein
MGDNFGPEFGASIQEIVRAPYTPGGASCNMGTIPGEHLPEALYKDDLRIADGALCDNVSHFLLDAGFRALVPGREDFMYGSGWLRTTAANLRDSMRSSNSDQRITMLAANLRLKVQASSAGAASDALKGVCPLLFSKDGPLLALAETVNPGQQANGIVTATCSAQTQDSPPELFDVLGRMSLLFNRPSVESSVSQLTNNPIQPPPSAANNRNQKLPSEIMELRTRILSNQLDQLRLMTSRFTGTADLLKQIKDLQSSLSKGEKTSFSEDNLDKVLDQAAKSAAPPSNPASPDVAASCKIDPVLEQGNRADILEFAKGLNRALQDYASKDAQNLVVDSDARRAGIRAILLAIDREQCDTGYTVTKIGGTTRLIVGVVGQSPILEVSKTNLQFCFTPSNGSTPYSYCDSKLRSGQLQAQVYVSDPVQAIVALTRAAKLAHPGIQSVIVMAQMPHTEAEELASAVQTSIDEQKFVEVEPLCKTESGEGSAPYDAKCATQIAEGRIPPIAFILSEAQDDHASGDFTISIERGRLTAPVLTPRRAYHIAGKTSFLLKDPASAVTVSGNIGGRTADLQACVCDTKSSQTQPQRPVRVRISNEELDPEHADHVHDIQTDYVPEPAPAERKTPTQASVLLANKLLGIPDARDPDPPSPYASISLGHLPNGHNRTVSDLLLDAHCDHPVDDSQVADCNLAVQHLLLLMLQRGSGAPHNPLTVFANPRGQVTDVSMLESRDIWLGELPEGYDSASVPCTRWLGSSPSPAKAACELRVALDIILWKGDLTARVQAKGSDLIDMMSTAQSLSSGERTLAAHDVSGAWLATFGIGRTGVTNIPSIAPRTDVFWVPEVSNCEDNDNAPTKAQSISSSASPSPASSQQKYCVDGKTVQDDASYWVVTSDHLAQDGREYKNLAALPDQYRDLTDCYLTVTIARAFQAEAHVPVVPCDRHRHPHHPAAPAQTARYVAFPRLPDPVNNDVEAFEMNQQLRPMFHIEFGKVVGGLDLREAVNGDSYVATQFQGVTDSRASAASQREIDVEQQMRGYFRFRNNPYQSSHKAANVWGNENRIGAQTDLEFDRSAQGNLTGKAENPTFPLNSVTGGIFFERHMFPGAVGPKIANSLQWLPPARMTPGRFALVLAPRQYQRQIIGNYLYFPFSPGAGPGPKNNSELTVGTDPAYGFSDRLGLRETATNAAPKKKSKLFVFDPGSYWEAGVQTQDQRHVLQSLTIVTPPATQAGMPQSVQCPATSNLTFANCAKQITINGKSYVSKIEYGDPTAWGLYWDVSLQEQISRATDQIHKVALQISSKGDRLAALRLPLSTETRWDAPLSTAISFQILPNLSVAPTYKGFWYSNQVAHGHLFVNEGLITFRWYFNRDSMTPYERQFFFNGPASDDQTKSMHMSKGTASQ